MNYHRALLHPDYFPVAQVAPLVKEWIDKWDAGIDTWEAFPDCAPMSGRDKLAFETGLTPRFIYRILNYGHLVPHRNHKERLVPSSTWIKFDNLDRLLLAMDLEYLWRVPVEDGGFDYPVIQASTLKKAFTFTPLAA